VPWCGKAIFAALQEVNSDLPDLAAIRNQLPYNEITRFIVAEQGLFGP